MGRTLQRFLLETTAVGIAHSYFNQPCEVRLLSDALSCELHLQGEYPLIILRLGYCGKAACSPRREIRQVML